ncbi:DUF4649 family protein [Streptococcus dentiloxodontae]
MIEVTILNASKQEQTITYDSYDEFERAQFACLTAVADYYKVIKLVYNGHELDYSDNWGNLYFYLSQLERSQFEN